MNYLHCVDKARFFGINGSVLTLNMKDLRKEMDKKKTGQRQQQMLAVECSNCGVAHSSRLQRGGNHESRRQRQRLKWELLRDERTVLQVLAKSLSSDQGSSNPKILETTGKLWISQQVGVPSEEKGKLNPAGQGSPLYVEVTPHDPSRIDEEEKTKEVKKKKMTKKKVKRVLER